MRAGSDIIWDLWSSGGVWPDGSGGFGFIGQYAASNRFTVEPDWDIHDDNPGQQPAKRQPCRWFQRLDNCADTETEILTRRGWLTWEQVEVGDEALAINPATGMAEWSAITNVHRAHRDDIEMLAMESAGHSSLTTLNHRWLMANGEWETSATLTTTSRIPTAADVLAPAVSPYSDAFVELVGWWWTEGCYDKSGAGGSVSQSRTANPQKLARIRDCLKAEFGAPGKMTLGRSLSEDQAREAIALHASGMPARAVGRQLGLHHTTVMRYVRNGAESPQWNERPERPTGVVEFGLSKQIVDRLRQVTDPVSKALRMSFITALTADQRRLLVETSIDGDGTYSDSTVLTQVTSPAGIERVDAFQALCVLTGIAVTKRPGPKATSLTLRVHRVTKPMSSAHNAAHPATAEIVRHTGVIWCPTLQHGNWLARRRGTVYYTGNSQVEKEFPQRNIVSVSIDRNISQDLGTCEVIVENTKMQESSALGEPGYYLYHHGSTAAERQRWNVTVNDWQGVLRPGCLVRTYGGFGGQNLSIPDAVAAGNLMMTGVWILDDVTPASDGTMTMEFRDVGALLVDQQMYPPLVPQDMYPTRYDYWDYASAAMVDPKPGLGMKNPKSSLSDVTLNGYRDYTDIIKDILRWSGYQLFGSGNDIYGNIETTGIFSDAPLTEDFFDKKAPLDVIKQFRDIVGYLTRIDEEGAFRFESPNWWSAGNIMSDGTRTDMIPDIDERMQLTQYSAKVTRQNERSLTVIGSTDPALQIPGTISVVYRTFFTKLASHAPSFIRAQNIPMITGVPAITVTAKDMKTMAELISLRMYFARRLGSVTMVANPAIGIDDQVRIWDRNTGECFIHYIQGCSSQYTRKDGTYFMTLETNWLGSSDDWQWAISSVDSFVQGQVTISQALSEQIGKTKAGAVYSVPPVAGLQPITTINQTAQLTDIL